MEYIKKGSYFICMMTLIQQRVKILESWQWEVVDLQQRSPRIRIQRFDIFQSDFVAQGGDFEMNNGYGGKSIYGQEFEDESLMFKHTRRGLLTMGNRGPNRNGSIFFITFQPCPKFDDKHVVFGEVAQETIEVLDWIEQNAATFGLPKATILIKDCGIWKDFKDKKFEEEFDWSIKPI